ncbi:MAG: septum formation protein Maf [Verrucomicrobia bacterium]|nr:septum formation protein Maf [Verrucomicrobiota bacterium]
MTLPLILGSSSPRRMQILNFFSLKFEVASPPFDESSLPFHGDPERYVRNLAQAKAESLISTYPDRVILTGDTIVYREGKLYPKPKDAKESFTFLKELAGNWHTVYSALCAFNKGTYAIEVQRTQVEIAPLTDEEIRRYQAAVKTSDKAGSYMLQENGSVIVRSIAGCPYNVIGMPIGALRTVLHHHGIDLWDHL